MVQFFQEASDGPLATAATPNPLTTFTSSTLIEKEHTNHPEWEDYNPSDKHDSSNYGNHSSEANCASG